MDRTFPGTCFRKIRNRTESVSSIDCRLIAQIESEPIACLTSLYFDILGLRIPAHTVLEMLAYTVGFQIYLRTRGRWKHPAVPFEQNVWIIIGCIFGALIGSKLLNIIDSPLSYWAHRDNLLFWFEGKTIVGGLMGGWIGVEIAKKRLGVRYATGDAYVFPLIAGMAIGRIGCFLNGLEDQTYGVATTLPWGIDFGDGVSRHPAQLYEIIVLLGIALWLLVRIRRPFPNGYIFRLFIFNYFIFRFLVEFIKPRFVGYLGLSGIQIASLAGALFCARIFLRNASWSEPTVPVPVAAADDAGEAR